MSAIQIDIEWLLNSHNIFEAFHNQAEMAIWFPLLITLSKTAI